MTLSPHSTPCQRALEELQRIFEKIQLFRFRFFPFLKVKSRQSEFPVDLDGDGYIFWNRILIDEIEDFVVGSLGKFEVELIEEAVALQNVKVDLFRHCFCFFKGKIVFLLFL